MVGMDLITVTLLEHGIGLDHTHSGRASMSLFDDY